MQGAKIRQRRHRRAAQCSCCHRATDGQAQIDASNANAWEFLAGQPVRLRHICTNCRYAIKREAARLDE